MSAVDEEMLCEKALLVVLPVFAAHVENDEPNLIVSILEIDDQTRELQSFRANFLSEVRRLEKLIREIVSPWNTTLDIESDDYVDILTDILTLFERYVSAKILDPDEISGDIILQNSLKVDDDTVFVKLGALAHRLIQTRKQRKLSFGELGGFITLTKKGKRRTQNPLKQITKYNRKLGSLLGYTSKFDSEKPPPETVRGSPPYDVRECAESLHRRLAETWHTTCKDDLHHAKLRLLTFAAISKNKLDGEDPPQWRSFDLLLSTHSKPGRWKQSRIQVMEKEANRPRTVAWPKASPLKKAIPTRIESICAIKNDADTDHDCLTICVEGSEMWKLPIGSGPDYLEISDQTPTVPLSSLIESRAHLSLKTKRKLGVILAYSLLYLSESSWLRREWTKYDICFCHTPRKGLDLGRPYFNTKIQPPETENEMEKSAKLISHLAPSLLGFGILLMELEFGIPIEDRWTKDDLTNNLPNPNSNLSAAKRLVEDENPWDEACDRLRLAVSACITGAFLTPETVVDFLSIQQAIYTNVVAHLEQELLHSFGIKADSLDNSPYHPYFPYRDANGCELNPMLSYKPSTEFPSRDPLSLNNKIYFPGSDHDEDEEARREQDSRFDSKVMSVPESKLPPSKAHHAEEFFRTLRDINLFLKSGSSSGRMPGLPVVKVAILDTGIHERHPLRGRLAGYHDFVEEHFTEDETLSLFAKDTTGHGSDMVELLYKTAPSVSIYVARVFSENSGDSSTAGYIAKAIVHAREKWNVDIISMSFGFEDEEEVTPITKAINESKNILMFAASSNFGVRDDFPIRYPARMTHRVICVSAADGIGHPYDGNPRVDSARNLSILGVDVRLTKQIDAQSAEPRRRYGTGTSIATPIAAGVAALVLEFARQAGMHKKVVDPMGELKTYVGMTAVLRRMCQTKHDFAFIRPETVLLRDRGKKELSGLDRMSKACEIISDALKHKYSYN